MTLWKLVLVALVAVMADQATKAVALTQLIQGVSLPVLPGVNLTLGFNEGSSFGMFSGMMAGKPLAMAGVTGMITLVLAVMAMRARNPLEAGGFSLAVGGSMGNILDRVRQGAVTDFLDLYWQNWHWPTFNLADVAIMIGAALVLVSALPFLRKSHEHA